MPSVLVLFTVGFLAVSAAVFAVAGFFSRTAGVRKITGFCLILVWILFKLGLGVGLPILFLLPSVTLMLLADHKRHWYWAVLVATFCGVIVFSNEIDTAYFALNNAVRTGARPAERNPADRIPSTESRVAPGSTVGTTSGTNGCPNHYLLVRGNSELGTHDFCVAQFEMKNDQGKAVSEPSGKPWNGVSRNQANGYCAELGNQYHLITNLEWQTVAREIESVSMNWSSGTVGSGRLNIGNFSREMGGAIETDPCATEGFTTRFPNCTDPNSSDFLRKRTHSLLSGQQIWDFGGNVFEWTSTDVSPETPGNFRGPVCALSDIYKKNFGPAGDYHAQCNQSNLQGLGCIEGEGGTVIFRGGQAGMEGSPWALCPGIFYANTNSYWSAQTEQAGSGPGFRCVYEPQ